MFFLSTTRHILPLLSQSHFKKCHYSPVIAHNFIIVVRLLPEYLSLEFSFTSVVQRDLEGWRWNADLFVTLFYIVRGPFPNTPKRTKTQIVLERFKIIQVHIYWSLWIVISATATWKNAVPVYNLFETRRSIAKIFPSKQNPINWAVFIGDRYTDMGLWCLQGDRMSLSPSQTRTAPETEARSIHICKSQ